MGCEKTVKHVGMIQQDISRPQNNPEHFGGTSQSTVVALTVVMPCLNEALPLAGAIASAQVFLAKAEEQFGLNGEIVVSDNGSTDGSVALAEREGVRVINCPTKGYGAALRAGFRCARGQFIVMGDSDGAHDFVDAIPMIEKLLEGFDVCMGSRFKGEIRDGAMPWLNRYIGNPALTGTLNLFFRAGVSDAHCGLRAFTREALERIKPLAVGMELASELVIKAALLNLQCTEVPITVHPDGRNREPHLRPWRDGWRHLRYLLMLSPGWLYFGPALLLGAVGFTLFALLLSHPSGSMVELVGIRLGDHWMPLSAVAIGLSHLGFLFGMATAIYGIREGYRLPTPVLAFALKCTKLNNMLVLGSGCVSLGIVLFVYVVYVWQTQEYGALQRIREMIASATMVQLGMQTILGGFMLAVLRGNHADAETPPGVD